MPFLDRREAGRRLVERLRAFRGPDTIVLGLPRGGMPVAFEVATALRVPLDVAVVCKLEVPDRPRLVFGAVAESGVRVVDDDLVVRAFIGPPERSRVERQARETVLRNSARLRRGRPQPRIAGRTVVLVDDGVTTGNTARAACELARARGAGGVRGAGGFLPPDPRPDGVRRQRDLPGDTGAVPHHRPVVPPLRRGQRGHRACPAGPRGGRTGRPAAHSSDSYRLKHVLDT
ncbi:phosphoribosyltransferase [Nocardia wallacei]|uniref:phosphoribosyltransferase n=1 Tax=Nocardia wallacei TaxID=480035 RepID=UPI002455EF3A|nr:phosphoribosyltransferase family protein [Nocardia wallacei]